MKKPSKVITAGRRQSNLNGSLRRLARRREQEPGDERVWWEVEYTTSMVPHSTRVEKCESMKAAMERRVELSKNYYYVRLVAVVERRTTLVRHDGTKPPSEALTVCGKGQVP